MAAQARILVVDDEPQHVQLLKAQLAPMGYEVVTATNGDDALAKAVERPIDLILADVMMPGLDGFALTRRLREDERTRLIPIVLVTALKGAGDRINGINAGCDDFISKPFDKYEVLARVRALLKISYYRSLVDEKEKFEQIMDRIDDGIIVFDPRLQPSRMNRRAADLLAIDPKDTAAPVIPQLGTRFTVHYDGDLGRDIMLRPLSFDLQRPKTATTASLVLAVRTSLVRDPLGNVSSIVLTVRDVTEERKEAFLKQDFLSLVSHKLRTPLTVIWGNASALQQGVTGSLNAQQQQMIEHVVEKSSELDRMISNLLSFTALQREPGSRAPVPIVLKEYLPSRVKALATRAMSKPIRWRLDCADPGATTSVRKECLDVIIGNLIDNAIKFNDKDVVTITVAAKRSAAGVELAISDNGPGIPPEARERVFEAFYQIDTEFTGNVPGAGLGLALVRYLVTAAGGAIQVGSTLGRGTTFTLTLPG